MESKATTEAVMTLAVAIPLPSLSRQPADHPPRPDPGGTWLAQQPIASCSYRIFRGG
jgi:hypothetical protein